MSASPPSSDHGIFATLRGDGRVWGVAAVHGEVDRLEALHLALAERFRPGDQIVYLGNYFGYGPAVRATVDELLLFRRRLMALGGAASEDVVFLRGAQEEMWQKLLQLQFAPNPAQVLHWMVERGIGATLAAYGGSADEGLLCAREGILALTKWTSGLRRTVRDFDGHTALMSVLRHAAFTGEEGLLFVPAGVDPGRPLSAQSDSFWWGGSAFASIAEPYGGFRRVVRGFDHARGGPVFGEFTATIDGGCGFGGPLVAACFAPGGEILDTIEGY